ncbi:MAG: WbuC family cupin fold metalloprotein [Bryobacteraceae bacterium]
MSPQLITPELIASVTEAARRSPRRRMNHNFHTGPGDNPHRFLNVFLRGSYVAPHRHLHPPKAESFLVLEGSMVAVVFREDGSIHERHRIGPGEPAWGIDLTPGVWHTVAALSEVAVCYEVKPGPWDPASDKEFATWAPREGDAAAGGYLERLLAEL